MKPKCVDIQMEAIKQYFHVVLFILLYNVVLTFKFADKTLVCDHSNESYWAVHSCGTVYHAVQGGSNFSFCGWNPSVYPVSCWAVFLRCCLLSSS